MKKSKNSWSQYPLYDTMFEHCQEPGQALDNIKSAVFFDCEDYLRENPEAPFSSELRDMAYMLRAAAQGQAPAAEEIQEKYGQPEIFWEIVEGKMQEWQHDHPDDAKLYCIRAEIALLLKPNSSIAESCAFTVLKMVKADSPDYGCLAGTWSRIAWAVNLLEAMDVWIG